MLVPRALLLLLRGLRQAVVLRLPVAAVPLLLLRPFLLPLGLPQLVADAIHSEGPLSFAWLRL